MRVTTGIVNFQKLIVILPDASLPSAACLSPVTSMRLVLEGDKLTVGPRGFVDNQYLWQGVDLVKQKGYTIDSVTMTGLGTTDNPDVYHVIQSHK